MADHTIVTSQFKFQLKNWERTIENSGGFPIIKYTALPHSVAFGPQISWMQEERESVAAPTNPKMLFEPTYLPIEPGTEILVIGDSIHFSCSIGGTLYSSPFLNYKPVMEPIMYRPV